MTFTPWHIAMRGTWRKRNQLDPTHLTSARVFSDRIGRLENMLADRVHGVETCAVGYVSPKGAISVDLDVIGGDGKTLELEVTIDAEGNVIALGGELPLLAALQTAVNS